MRTMGENKLWRVQLDLLMLLHHASMNPCTKRLITCTPTTILQHSSISAYFLQATPPDVDSTAVHTQADKSHAAAADSPQASAATAASEQRWRAAMSAAPPKKGEVWGRSPHLGVGWKCVSDASAVTEVHLRRLDVGDDLHRRVVAVLTVDATPQEVRKGRNIQALLLGLVMPYMMTSHLDEVWCHVGSMCNKEVQSVDLASTRNLRGWLYVPCSVGGALPGV